MKTRIYTTLSLVVILSLITIPIGHLRATAQDQTDDDFFIYLPLVSNNYTPLPPGYTSGQGTTDSSGEIIFAEPNVNGEITVQVEEESGIPISDATVYFLSDGSEGRAIVITSDQRVGWGTVQYPSSYATSSLSNVVVDPFTATIVVIIVGGSLATYHLIALTNDPPRIDLELGYARVCMTYEAFKHTAGVGLSIFALHTAVAHSAYIAAGEIGAEKFVFEASPHIVEALGVEWPWEGTWCFRQSHFLGMSWWTPESDTIQDAEFYARIRWDKADTDVDLHAYDSLGNHAYYGNKDGIPGGYLDHDDTDGWGPEVYRQVSYEGSEYYEIRVHYYSDHGNGSTNVTIEIFDDEDRLIKSDTKLMSDEEWWYVDTIYPTSHPLNVDAPPPESPSSLLPSKP